MDLDFEDLITQSIITNSAARRVSVKTTQSREYDLVYNKRDSTFEIKVKKDGFICEECGEIYEEEDELTHHKQLQKCRRKYKTKAELKEIPFENDVNKFLQINISTYNEITDDDSAAADEEAVAAATGGGGGQSPEAGAGAHTAKEEFKCEQCGREIASKLGLTSHMQMHVRASRRAKQQNKMAHLHRLN